MKLRSFLSAGFILSALILANCSSIRTDWSKLAYVDVACKDAPNSPSCKPKDSSVSAVGNSAKGR